MIKNCSTLEKDKNLLSHFVDLIVYRTLHKDIIWIKQDIDCDNSMYRGIEFYRSEPRYNNGFIFEIIAYQDRYTAENDNYRFEIVNGNNNNIIIKTANIKSFDSKEIAQRLFRRILVAARESIEETILTEEAYNNIAEYIDMFDIVDIEEE